MKTCIKMSQSEDTVDFIKKWKKNDEKEGQDRASQHTWRNTAQPPKFSSVDFSSLQVR